MIHVNRSEYYTGLVAHYILTYNTKSLPCSEDHNRTMYQCKFLYTWCMYVIRQYYVYAYTYYLLDKVIKLALLLKVIHVDYLNVTAHKLHKFKQI